MKIYNYGATAPQNNSTNNKTSRKASSQKFSLKNWRKTWRYLPWTKIGTWGFRLGALGVLFIAFLFIYYSRSLPDPNRLLGRDVPQSTKIYARDNSLLYEVHGEVKRTLVNLDDISPNLKNATIVAEDRNFYNHAGISITGLLRSAFVDIIHGQKREGGSTITQQFVKNAVLTNQKSYLRKVKEIILSIELEARFSKNDILKMYLNEIPYGRNAYGIEAASETYFGKHAKDLTVAESAYLAALPQAPSYYNPSGPHFDDLEARQKYILSQMHDLKYINDDQYNQALNENVQFSAVKDSIVAPHFVQYVEDYLANKYGEDTLEEGGLKVYTTLDPKLQQIAEKAVSDGAAKNISAGGYNAALVAEDPKTGQILAMVGSKDYFGDSYPKDCNPKTCLFSPNVNIATTLQQPGSSFKPYAYVTAFGKDYKYSPASMLVDVKTDFGGGYSPNNFNLSSNGPVSMRKALAGSLNVPAVKTLALVGPDKVVDTARSLGINAQFSDCGLSLVLGGCDITLLDHTEGYSAFANNGRKEDQTSILKVVSEDGKTLEEYKEHGEQVLDPQAVYELTNVLSDNQARTYVFGANSALQLGDRPVAAKTGTTQDFRDGWTMGYTPSLVAGVWTGNNNNAPMTKDAVLTAGPIWQEFMKGALAGTPIEQFNKPDGIQTVTVDALTGLLPTQYTPQTKQEIFADYAVPTKYDNVHLPVQVDSNQTSPDSSTLNPDSSDQSSSDSSPSSSSTTKVCTVLHSEKPDNPNWENPVVAWALEHSADGYCYPPGSGISNTPTDGNITITSPSDGDIITTSPVIVAMNVKGDNVTSVEVSVDGQTQGTANTSPYRVKITNTFPDGEHTIAAKVIYSDGTSFSDSVDVVYSLNGQLQLSISGGGSDFPLDLTADTPEPFGSVTFYVQHGSSSSVLGRGSVSKTGVDYSYEYMWGTQPASGSYTIYAKSNSGVTSNKISIAVP